MSLLSTNTGLLGLYQPWEISLADSPLGGPLKNVVYVMHSSYRHKPSISPYMHFIPCYVLCIADTMHWSLATSPIFYNLFGKFYLTSPILSNSYYIRRVLVSLLSPIFLQVQVLRINLFLEILLFASPTYSSISFASP